MWIVFLAGNRLSSVKYKIYRLFKNIRTFLHFYIPVYNFNNILPVVNT